MRKIVKVCRVVIPCLAVFTAAGLVLSWLLTPDFDFDFEDWDRNEW